MSEGETKVSMVWTGRYIRVREGGMSPSGKTRILRVESEKGEWIGTIAWWGAWRKYAFLPASDTVYEEVCLGELALLVKAMTLAHWAMARNGPAGTTVIIDKDPGRKIELLVGTSVIAFFPDKPTGLRGAQGLAGLLKGGA